MTIGMIVFKNLRRAFFQGVIPERTSEQRIASSFPPSSKFFPNGRGADAPPGLGMVFRPALAELPAMNSESAEWRHDRVEICMPCKLRPEEIVPSQLERPEFFQVDLAIQIRRPKSGLLLDTSRVCGVGIESIGYKLSPIPRRLPTGRDLPFLVDLTGIPCSPAHFRI